jgi:carbonic anhydrase
MLLISVSSADSSTTKGEDKHETKHHGKHWGYSGDVSPAHWGELDEKFKMCAEGKMQTPIDVLANKDVDLPLLDLKYSKGSKNIIDNGHAVQVNIESGDIFDIEGTPYELKQFHFHTPSENHIKGVSYPMEAHFVHATKDGKLAVIAVMFEEGAENPTLTKINKMFPLEHNKAVELKFSDKDLNAILPEKKEYYKFMGSLTTPPCSEHVKWFVFKSPQTASKAQIEAMHKQINKMNNRPIQPTNNREIDE